MRAALLVFIMSVYPRKIRSKKVYFDIFSNVLNLSFNLDVCRHSEIGVTVSCSVLLTNLILHVTGEVSWLCPDCIVGKKPFIGDIVWVKFGAYRFAFILMLPGSLIIFCVNV